jgi:DNA modification methylase
MEVDRIICGDCLEVMKDFPDNSVDLVLTDPPYGIGIADWDNETPPDDIFGLFYRLLKPNGSLYYWGNIKQVRWILNCAEKQGFISRSRLNWWFATGHEQKTNYRQDVEDCWFFTKSTNNTFNTYIEPYEDKNNYKRYGKQGKAIGCVFRENRLSPNHPKAVEHPTQKPLGIFYKLASISSDESDIILDPFCGSGTTCVAAKMLGRHYIGIDISEKYCEIARKRVEAAEKGITVKELEKGQGVLF